MARPRQPIEVIEAKGKKHLTKAEIESRKSSEPKPITENINPPTYLLKAQKKQFIKYADQLKRLGILGETDIDALARYVIANDMYIHVVKQLRKVKQDPLKFEAWAKLQDRYFKQCKSAANDLGLSISSRCRLVVPEPKSEPPKKNKFTKFEKRAAGE
ncbi:MAG: phage terminase small subunit P27 family [Ruminococcus sp.]|nr:phage terminase small subunit P27 family [Ruminococcus sp.]